MKQLNVIGAGRVGKTLAHLWATNKLLEIGSVLNTSLKSGADAVTFIGAGTAVSDASELSEAQFHMLTVNDKMLPHCVELLLKSEVVKPLDIVFHCSGILSSQILNPLSTKGAFTASVHPVKSFADTAHAILSFAGTPCGFEGDSGAIEALQQLFLAIGAKPFVLNSSQKTLYHTGLNMACQNLVALLEASVEILIKSGLERSKALQLVQSLAEETLKNVGMMDTRAALTGPASRGDDEIINMHINALAKESPELSLIYHELSKIALKLAR